MFVSRKLHAETSVRSPACMFCIVYAKPFSCWCLYTIAFYDHLLLFIFDMLATEQAVI